MRFLFPTSIRAPVGPILVVVVFFWFVFDFGDGVKTFPWSVYVLDIGRLNCGRGLRQPRDRVAQARLERSRSPHERFARPTLRLQNFMTENERTCQGRLTMVLESTLQTFVRCE